MHTSMRLNYEPSTLSCRSLVGASISPGPFVFAVLIHNVLVQSSLHISPYRRISRCPIQIPYLRVYIYIYLYISIYLYIYK